MKIQALLLIGITTSLSYSAQQPTPTGLLVSAAKHRAQKNPLLQTSLNDIAANTAEQELQKKLLHRLTLNAETSEIASKKEALAQLQERRRDTMGALDLQLRRRSKKAEPAIVPSAKSSEPVVVAAAEENDSDDLFPTGLSEEYKSEATAIFLYNALSNFCNPAYLVYRDNASL